MRVKLRLLRHVTDAALEGLQVLADVLTVEDHVAGGRFEQPGKHLDGCALAGPVWAKITENFARPDGEAYGVHHGDAAVALGQKTDFQHVAVRHLSNAVGSRNELRKNLDIRR